MHITLTPTPDADTAAAVIAAIACLIGPETADDTPAPSAWRAASGLEAQGMPPARNGTFATWHTAERARRAERWSGGIIGL